MFKQDIKKISDLEECIGKKTARAIINRIQSDNQKGTVRKRPSTVHFHNTKPEFYLNDGETLKLYLIDLEKQEIEGEYYCGSGDTAINHKREQFSSGLHCKAGFAYFFITKYWNGKNSSWDITVVSDSLTGQIGHKTEYRLEA